MIEQVTSSRRQVLLAMAACAVAPYAGLTKGATPFRVFDALLYLRKPDLTSYGITPLPTPSPLWHPESPRDRIDLSTMRAALAKLPADTKLFFIDIEYWPLLQVPEAVLASSAANYKQVVTIVRAMKPGVRFGFYNVIPVGVYWAILMKKSPEYADWQRVNRALDPLGASVDVLFPSLYTFYNDQDGWMAAAEGLLSEARRHGKPVYPFLWPQYHDSNAQLAGEYIPTDFWRAQLRFCRDHADGIVLWGGYQQPWDDDASWWRATLQTLSLTQLSL
jgi:hypothetical protein